MVKWTKSAATAKAGGAERSPRPTDGRAGAPSPAEKAKKAKKEAR